MKQAKINSLIAAATIVCFAILAVIVPPVTIVGQITKETPIDTVKYAKYRSDSLGLEAVRWLGEVEREKYRIDSLNKAVEINTQNAQDVKRWVNVLIAKTKSKPKVKHIPVPFLIPVNTGLKSDNQVIINSFIAPKYEGTKIRTHQTYFEWKQGRGLFQKKDYNTYLNKVYGK